MRGMFILAGILASVVFLISLPFSFFADVNHWSGRLLVASLPAAMTFVATILLCLRDHSEFKRHMIDVQHLLMERSDTSEDDFINSSPEQQRLTLLQTRVAIAEYFDVLPSKILATDDLRTVLRADKLEPSFQFFVIDSVIAKNTDKREVLCFGLEGLLTVADLSKAIEEILQGINSPDE